MFPKTNLLTIRKFFCNAAFCCALGALSIHAQSFAQNANSINNLMNPSHTNVANNSASNSPTLLSAPPSRWPIGIFHKSGWMRPNISTLKARIEATHKSPEYADPVALRVVRNSTELLFKQLAQERLLETSALDVILSLKTRIRNGKFIVTPEDLSWIDLEKLASVLQSKTALPELVISEWNDALENPKLRANLKAHFRDDFERIRKLLNSFEEENPDTSQIPFQDLLSPRVKPLYGKYSHLRGRNCFGTALEFANPRTVINKVVNTEAEEGHFRTMINSDEFARALWLGYDELSNDDILMGLQWGDVVVFYDASTPFAWQQLRHAVVHLAGDIYFHKQSKSAASPIELVEWNSLVSLWQSIAPALDYKVYRRLPLGPGGKAFQKPTRAIEKLSWTR